MWPRAEGIELFRQTQQESVEPKPSLLLGFLNACCQKYGHLKRVGRQAHKQIIKTGYKSEIFVEIVSLTCMPNVGARRRFGECSTRCSLYNVVSWNAMCGGFAVHNSGG